MDRRAVEATIAGLSAMFEGDGAALRVTAVDDERGSVDLVLALDDVSCADCVLPPDRLREVIGSTLRREVPGVTAVVLDDPREAAAPAAPPPAVIAAAEAFLTVLDPTGEVPVGNPDPGPDAGPLAGRRVGFRVDVLWPTWDTAVDEWTRALEAAGATVTQWRRRQGLKGAEGEAAQAEYEAFVGGIDVLISGLGNCGSCTSWSVNDGLTGLAAELPTVVGVTANFEGLARALATDRGRPGLRLVVLPFAANNLTEAEVRAAARELFPILLETLGATVAVPAGVA